jgi:hypothetical protein
MESAVDCTKECTYSWDLWQRELVCWENRYQISYDIFMTLGFFNVLLVNSSVFAFLTLFICHFFSKHPCSLSVSIMVSNLAKDIYLLKNLNFWHFHKMCSVNMLSFFIFSLQLHIFFVKKHFQFYL